jgi:hypothetical protein
MYYFHNELPCFCNTNEESLTFENLLTKEQKTFLSVKSKRRLKTRWYVSINHKSGKRTLIVPSYFNNAPFQVKKALIEWALLPFNKKNADYRSYKKNLENIVIDYIKLNGLKIKRFSRLRPELFITKGIIYDLKEVFNSLNNRFFNGSLSSYVRWGKHLFRSYQSIKHGINGDFSLITIASTYNKPDVPRYAIEGIMYHEMLHIAYPPQKVNGRNIIHGELFKQKEKEFPYYNDWRNWEKSNFLLKKRIFFKYANTIWT